MLMNLDLFIYESGVPYRKMMPPSKCCRIYGIKIMNSHT